MNMGKVGTTVLVTWIIILETHQLKEKCEPCARKGQESPVSLSSVGTICGYFEIAILSGTGIPVPTSLFYLLR